MEKTSSGMTTAPDFTLMPISKPTDAMFGIGSWGNPEEVAKLMAEEKKYIEATGAVESRQGIRVSAKGQDPVIVTNCFVNIEDVGDVKISEAINFYDLLVFSAYCSIIDAGNVCCTPRQILKVMTGGRQSRNSEPVGSIRDIERSMDKMRRTFVTMDWSEQARAWGGRVDMEGVESFNVETYMIPADKITEHFDNGAEATAYVSLEYPKLFRYVKAIRQYVTVRPEALDIDVQMTHRNMVIRGYLIRKIEQLRSPSARGKRSGASNNSIRFETMINQCDLDVNSRKMDKTIKDTTFKILDCFAESGYIDRYKKIFAEKGKVVSVRIFV